MMKKVIATALCLTITAPCFAAGRYNPNRMDCPRYEQGYDCRRNNHRLPRPDCRSSQRTKTLAAVAGIAGVAMLISAIAD